MSWPSWRGKAWLALGIAALLATGAPAQAARPATSTALLMGDGASEERQAQELDRLGRPRAAEPLLRKALESGLRASAPSLQSSARYAALARNLDAQGRHAEAEPLHRKALVLARVADEPTAAGLAADFARCLDGLGRHDEAQALLRRALTRAKTAETIATLNSALGATLDAAGYRAQAEPLLRAALQANTGGGLAAARDSARLARNLVGQGRYAESEALYRAALAIERQRFGESHYRLAATLEGLAADLDLQGRHVEAEALLRRSLEIRHAAFGDASRNTARSYRHAADNLNAQNRFDAAEPLYRKALAIDLAALGAKHLDVATDEANLAVNLDAQRRHGEAEPLHRKALALRRAGLGERSETTAASYRDLAANLLAQGKAKDAERLDRRALAMVRKALGEWHPLVGVTSARLAADLEAQGKHEAAELLLRAALDIRLHSLGENHRETALAYDAMAQNLSAQQAPEAAETLSTKAVSIVRERRRTETQSSGGGADGALRRAQAEVQPQGDAQIYARHLQLTWLAAANTPADLPRLRDDAFRAAQEMEISPAGRALAQTAARGAAGAPAAKDARRQQDLAHRARLLEGQLVKSLPDIDSARPAQLASALAAVGHDLANLDARLDRDNPRYERPAATPAGLSLRQTQRRLRPGEALLLLAASGEDIYVFAVSRSGVAWTRVEGRRAIEQRIHALRCQVDDRTCAPASRPAEASAPAFDTGAALDLYRRLIAPVEPAFNGADRLFVTASGALATLPLSMLATAVPAPGDLRNVKWLGDRYALTTLPAVSNLRATRTTTRRPAARQWAFVGYGAPMLNGAKPVVARRRGADDNLQALADPAALRKGFPALPGADAELRAMAAALGAPNASLRMGVRATETSVKTSPALARAQVVDFATHGLMSNEVKGIEEPGLLFTPPASATSQDDGVLTASEAAQLKLNAEWLILSACNTAAPDGTPGADSLSGLAQAFLYAGAKALLVSHWHVYDESTAALTVETLTVQRANPRLTKAQALQRAIATVRTGRRADGTRLAGWSAEWGHPAYWAPFVLIGSGE